MPLLVCMAARVRQKAGQGPLINRRVRCLRHSSAYCPALVCRQVGMCLLCCFQHKLQPIPVSTKASLPARKSGLLAPALVHATGNTCMCAGAKIKPNAVVRSSDWRWPAPLFAPASAQATHGAQATLRLGSLPKCGKPDPSLKLAQQHPRSAKMPAHPRAHTQIPCADRKTDICPAQGCHTNTQTHPVCPATRCARAWASCARAAPQAPSPAPPAPAGAHPSPVAPSGPGS